MQLPSTTRAQRTLVAAGLALMPLPALAAGPSAPVLIGSIVAGLAVIAAIVAVKRPIGLVIAAVTGAAISLYLGLEHYNALAGGSSICSVSETINCDKVNTSTYSEIGPIPIALLGFGFYVGMTWISVAYLRTQTAANLALVVVGTGLGLAYNAFLAWASYQVGAVCPFCVATYTINAILFAGALVERHGKGGALMADLFTALQNEGAAVVISGLAGLLVGNLIARPQESPAEVVASGGSVEALVAYYEQAEGQVTFDRDDPYKGAENPKYEIVEWADFQCPHCGMVFPKLKSVIEQNPDVRLYYKHYPIAQACNPNVGWEGHVDACGAAAAAVCANHNNSFWPLAEKMFKNQEYLDPASLRFLLTDVGLDADALMRCIEDPATKSAVALDVAAGTKAGVHGTPAIFLRGLFGDQWVSIKGSDVEINALLKAHRSGATLPPPPPPSHEAH